MRIGRLTALVILASCLTVAGCGRRKATPVPQPSVMPTEFPVEPDPSPIPLPSIEPGYPPGGGYGNSLVARVEYTKNGIVFGMGRFIAQIRVHNPTPRPLGGQLIVEFWASDYLVNTIREPVFLAPGETQMRTYENPAWRVNMARASILTQTQPWPGTGLPYPDPEDPRPNPYDP